MTYTSSILYCWLICPWSESGTRSWDMGPERSGSTSRSRPPVRYGALGSLSKNLRKGKFPPCFPPYRNNFLHHTFPLFLVPLPYTRQPTMLLTISHCRPIATMGGYGGKARARSFSSSQTMETGVGVAPLSGRRHGGVHAQGSTQGVGGPDFWCQESPPHVLGAASWVEDFH